MNLNAWAPGDKKIIYLENSRGYTIAEVSPEEARALAERLVECANYVEGV